MDKAPDFGSTPVGQGEKDDHVTDAPATDVEAGHGADLKNIDIKAVDKAFEYASSDAISIDEKTNKYLLRKIDLHILPWLCGLYVLQFLDKGM